MGTKKATVHGMSHHRLRDNQEESLLAKTWSNWNDEGRRTLAYLLDPRHGDSPSPPDVADRDAVVAATVIQWLGSPVGQSFLEEAGYVKAKIGR
jgi:hypothetical protein